MPIPGNLFTTAMAVMPHRDVERALERALSLDIPFWPQLPLLDYHEDMYVQAAEHFPGILLDLEKRTLRFSHEKFLAEVEETLSRFEEPDYFDVSPAYSAVYHRFLSLDLCARPAIRGQLEGPVSFGFNVVDETGRPVIFDDGVRGFLLEFMARRANVQLRRLKERNPNAFMFIDEPGLQFVFSGMSGYGEGAARKDMDAFFALLDRPRGVHLCGNPDWDFLLQLDLDVLSLDVYNNGEVFVAYAAAIRRFLDRGGTLVWGVVPSHTQLFDQEDIYSLKERLTSLWSVLDRKGVDRAHLLSRSLLSPATCCLVNPDGESTVDRVFAGVKEVSQRLRDEFRLG